MSAGDYSKENIMKLSLVTWLTEDGILELPFPASFPSLEFCLVLVRCTSRISRGCT
jgi:hypothetical protein